MNYNPYTALATADHGSVEHLQAVADIQAMEKAYQKSQENVIKGSGVSGHAYASATIVSPDAVPSNIDTYLGPMSVGVASPDMREGIVRIGDMETSVTVAEAMRRGMSAEDWKSLTGREYVSLTQAQPQTTSEATKDRFKNDPKLADTQQKLDEANDLEAMIKANEDQNRQETDLELQSYEASLLEKVLEQHYGTDITTKVQRKIIDSGDLSSENLAKLGVTEEMTSEVESHYRVAAEKMLEPVGSCTAYLENFLSEAEAKLARAAIVGRDMNEVQRLGMIARDRAASMDLKMITEFLSKEERLQLRVRQEGTLIMVDLPGVGQTSWASAVTNGLISFR
jgi:hypothetical protein